MSQQDDLVPVPPQPTQGSKLSRAEQDAGLVEVIPVVEEQLRIDKKLTETGIVRISKQVTERAETLTVPLAYEEIQVERVAINQFIDAAPPAVRYEGETMIISVMKEVAVVEKRLMLVEELHVTKRLKQRQEAQTVRLREEAVNFEHINTSSLGHSD